MGSKRQGFRARFIRIEANEESRSIYLGRSLGKSMQQSLPTWMW